jgi:hypothetical protein
MMKKEDKRSQRSEISSIKVSLILKIKNSCVFQSTYTMLKSLQFHNNVKNKNCCYRNPPAMYEKSRMMPQPGNAIKTVVFTCRCFPHQGGTVCHSRSP